MFDLFGIKKNSMSTELDLDCCAEISLYTFVEPEICCFVHTLRTGCSFVCRALDRLASGSAQEFCLFAMDVVMISKSPIKSDDGAMENLLLEMASLSRRKLFKLYGPKPAISYMGMVSSLSTKQAGSASGPIL